MNDKAGSKYYGPKEDQALFITLKKVINNPLVEIIDVDAHINEEAFAISVKAFDVIKIWNDRDKKVFLY